MKRNSKKVSSARVKGTENATSIVVSGSASASPIAIGESINQTFTSTTNNIISNLPHGIEKKASRPSPVEIASELYKAKPFDRLLIKNKFDGLEVSRPCTFSTISKYDDDTFNVSFDSLPSESNIYYRVSIWVRVRAEDYPKLKIVDEEHPAWIEARIRRVDSILPHIDLEDNPKITLD